MQPEANRPSDKPDSPDPRGVRGCGNRTYGCRPRRRLSWETTANPSSLKQEYLAGNEAAHVLVPREPQKVVRAQQIRRVQLQAQRTVLEIDPGVIQQGAPERHLAGDDPDAAGGDPERPAEAGQQRRLAEAARPPLTQGLRRRAGGGGRLEGDAVANKVVGRLERAESTRERDHLRRLGGDEGPEVLGVDHPGVVKRSGAPARRRRLCSPRTNPTASITAAAAACGHHRRPPS